MSASSTKKTEDITPEERYLANERLVWWVINRHYPTFLSDEDLAQEARIGLWYACQAYDPERGAFSNLAYYSILNEIRRYFRRQQWGNPPKDMIVSTETPILYSNRTREPVMLREALVGDQDVDWSDMPGLIEKLGDLDRKILSLRLDGLSLREIGEHTSLSHQAVNKRLSKIADLVRRYI